MDMTIAQARGARGMLNWSAAALAEASSIGIATVKRFEGGQPVQSASIHAMQRALEAAGIVFIADGEPSLTAGAGVRLARLDVSRKT